MQDSLTRTGSEPQSVAPLGIIAMDGCSELGKKVNDYLVKWEKEPENADQVLLTHPGYQNDGFLLDADCPRFSSGEGKGVIRQSVRGYDLYILCDVTNYSKTYRMYGMEVPMSPDDYYQDLKRIIAAEGKKAKRVSVVMPYLYEGRQHRRAARESLDCAMMLQELTALGIDNIITFDAHDPRVQNAIPHSGFENVMPYYQMLKALLRKLPDLRIDRDHMMIVSPDEGAAGRNIYYATMLGLDMGLFYKRRDYSVVVNGRNPIVAHEYMGESVEGKDVLIADDILATGDSMLDLARELKRRKCGRIFMATTFAMFTNGIDVFKKAYEEGLFDYILATNLSYLRPELRDQPWFIEVDMSKYIALIIATLNHDRSISPLLNPLQRIQKLLTRHRAALMEQDIK
ncbi:MAG: ribose-phosphate pyrophosphokinase [Candidatus Spyradocola sp.]|nr:ribose-phosphate pyrophosphokinase [Candidatus Spyradocola sp.]